MHCSKRFIIELCGWWAFWQSHTCIFFLNISARLLWDRSSLLASYKQSRIGDVRVGSMTNWSPSVSPPSTHRMGGKSHMRRTGLQRPVCLFHSIHAWTDRPTNDMYMETCRCNRDSSATNGPAGAWYDACASMHHHFISLQVGKKKCMHAWCLGLRCAVVASRSLGGCIPLWASPSCPVRARVWMDGSLRIMIQA